MAAPVLPALTIAEARLLRNGLGGVDERRVLLHPDALRRVVVHGDHLGRREYLQATGVAERAVGRPYEHNRNPELLGCATRPGNYLARSMVTSHGVNCYWQQSL